MPGDTLEIAVTTTGLGEFQSKMDGLDGFTSGEHLAEAALQVAEQIVEWVRPDVPVQTGWMRDHLRAEAVVVSESEARAYAGWDLAEVPYAESVIFGTAHMPARPILQQAVDQHAAEIEAMLVKVVQDRIREALG